MVNQKKSNFFFKNLIKKIPKLINLQESRVGMKGLCVNNFSAISIGIFLVKTSVVKNHVSGNHVSGGIPVEIASSTASSEITSFMSIVIVNMAMYSIVDGKSSRN